MCGASCAYALEGGSVALLVVEQQEAVLAGPCIGQELSEGLGHNAAMAVVSNGVTDGQLPKLRVRMVVQEVVDQGCGELACGIGLGPRCWSSMVPG